MKKVKTKTEIANGIITRRKALGLSAMAFSEKIGIPYPTIRTIEAGESQGNPTTRQIIAEFFKCSVSDLYLPAQAISPREKRADLLISIIGRLPNLDERQLRLVASLIEQLPLFERLSGPAIKDHVTSILLHHKKKD